MQIRKYNKWLTFLIVIYPILSIYSSTISTLTISDVLCILTVFCGIAILISKKKIVVNKEWLFYFTFLCIHFAISNLFILQDITDFMEFLRYALYIFMISVMVPSFFRRKKGIIYLRCVSLFVSCFAIIQGIGLYLFRMYIPGVIKALPLMRKELYIYGGNYQSGVLRARSVFAEPAHLAAYLALYLVICLFNEKEKHAYIDAFIVTVALIFSVSSTAYIILTVVWGSWVLFSLHRNKNKITTKKILLVLFLFFIIGLAFTFFLKTELFKMFWGRTVLTQEATMGRLDGYRIFSDSSIWDNKIKFFGNGYVDAADYYYLASFATMYWRYGVLGLFIWIIICLRYFICCRKTVVEKMIMFIFLFLGVGTLAFFSYTIMFYVSFTEKGVENLE